MEFGAKNPTFLEKLNAKLKFWASVIASVGDLKLSVGKLKLPAILSPNFLYHDVDNCLKITNRNYNDLYARQLYRQVLLRVRISYGISVRLSVCLSVLVSRLGTDTSPGQRETPGFHLMILIARSF